MEKINKKREVMFGIFLIGILFSMTLISSFSVGMPYMEDKKLYLSPGDIRNLDFVLQNSGGTENSNAKVIITEGSEIIELIDSSDVYVVIPGKQTKVNFKVTIPEDAQIGDSYHVKLDFSAEAGAGSFSFGSAIEQNFDIIIGEKPELVIEQEEEKTSSNNLLLYGGVIFVLIVLVIFFVMRKRRK